MFSVTGGKGSGPEPRWGDLAPDAEVHWLLLGLVGLEEEGVVMQGSEKWVLGIVE